MRFTYIAARTYNNVTKTCQQQKQQQQSKQTKKQSILCSAIVRYRKKRDTQEFSQNALTSNFPFYICIADTIGQYFVP